MSSVDGLSNLKLSDLYLYEAGEVSGSSTQQTLLQSQLPEADDKQNLDDKTTLTPPAGSVSSSALSSASAACASFFGSVLALIQQTTSELIRDNRELSYQAQMQAADSMEEQADVMRDSAKTALVIGIVQGAVQIAGGMAQFGMTMHGLRVSSGSDTLMQAWNSKAQGIGQAIQGVSTALGSAGSFVTSMQEAEIKEMEADQKRIEALAEQVQSINDSFRQTVQAAIEASKTISQSMVETNKRILA